MIKNKFLNGLLLGMVLPLLSFAALYYLNEALVSSDSVSVTGNDRMLWRGFKLRTLVLMALCINLIPTFFANRRFYEEFVRGIMVPTVIYCFIWFFYFRDALFAGA